ncbi:hypothetical protein PanWU01x14_291220 [Parasponia andersonii]|uniref:Uncharacterized protein n=1 Tax=Parasponia andersonii TaxID=3476 RepID=A0A2P5AXE5_PARAD|nr:hypothetical protein PanWU01x14_291220 [Parasponia andersonii]
MLMWWWGEGPNPKRGEGGGPQAGPGRGFGHNSRGGEKRVWGCGPHGGGGGCGPTEGLGVLGLGCGHVSKCLGSYC